jgi:hypothetical protein
VGLALVAELLAIAAGCSKTPLVGQFVPNQRPEVWLSQTPKPAPAASGYTCEISWAGLDHDGRITLFRYALDPPSSQASDTAWVATTENRHSFVFQADSSGSDGLAHGLHTFVVEALDDRGAISAPVHCSFNATTVAPTVVIRQPPPTHLYAVKMPTGLKITWQGTDPDGLGGTKPVGYRYQLFTEASAIPILAILLDPDTLRRAYGPSYGSWNWAGPDVNAVELHDLTPQQSYIFAVVARDTAGACSRVLSFDENLLFFQTLLSEGVGPALTLYNESFSMSFASGGSFVDPSSWIHAEFAADLPVVLNWKGVPGAGRFVQGYRWSVDLPELSDETPRTNEGTDLAHWSRWSTGTTIVLPAFSPANGANESHFFYLMAEDDQGFRSVCVLQFNIVRATFDKPLLIVDDTWLTPDWSAPSGCTVKPRLSWPTAAELDTFFYAVGGVPWNCYPAGTTSPPGVFAGYDFDTVGTHNGNEFALTLGRLAHYRNIIWMVDQSSAFVSTGQFGGANPMPLLHAWTMPGRGNPLVTWLQQGGRLWVMGGGAGYASTIEYVSNQQPKNVFSFDQGELVPGRFMYNRAGWRSEFTAFATSRARLATPPPVPRWPGAPDYSQLPALLSEKSVATDPVPPQRVASQFYSTTLAAEYLTQPNSVSGEDPATPGTFRSVLDTLYVTQGGQAGNGRPIMTLYHPSDQGPVIFSGFPTWFFQRGQCIALTDFVLQRFWGMTRRPVPR